MILDKKYEDITKKEKIEYNRKQVESIFNYIDSLPMIYCGGISCYICPLNISSEKEEIFCLMNIKKHR